MIRTPYRRPRQTQHPNDSQVDGRPSARWHDLQVGPLGVGPACDHGAVRLRRTPWPQELVDAVRAAAAQASAGRDDILAAVQLTDARWVAGGRAALYLPEDRDGGDDAAGIEHQDSAGDQVGVVVRAVRRIGWEKIERAGWDSEKSVLHVWETTSFGTPLRATDLPVDDPGKFGQLLRERIDASVLVQRHVPLVGKKGVRVVGRRNPADPDAEVAWSFVLDKGLSPDQPGLVDNAEAALKAVRDEFGI